MLIENTRQLRIQPKGYTKDCHLGWYFLTLAQTKALTRQWLEEYNEIRSIGSLGGLSPLQFLRNFRSDKSIINKIKLPEYLTLEVD